MSATTLSPADVKADIKDDGRIRCAAICATPAPSSAATCCGSGRTPSRCSTRC